MLPPEVLGIRRAVFFVQSAMGLAFGLFIFTYGPYLYNRFGGVADAQHAMLLTTALMGVRYGFVALLEIPTGAYADAMGRGRAVRWSFFFRMIFFVCLASISLTTDPSTAFVCGMFASVALAFAMTLYSGAFTAWVVDALRRKAPAVGYEAILARGYEVQHIMYIVGCLIGVSCFLLQMAYVAYLLGATLCFACMVYCTAALVDPSVQDITDTPSLAAAAKRIGEIVGRGFAVSRRVPAILTLVGFFAAFMFLLTLVEYLWPVALQNQFGTREFSTQWLAMAVAAGSMSWLGARVLTVVSNRWRRKNMPVPATVLRRILLLTAFCSTIPVIGLATVFRSAQTNFTIFAAVVLLVECSYGLIPPCYESLINHHIPTEHAGERATVLSVGSFIKGLLIFALSIPAGDQSGNAALNGWVVPAVLLLVASCAVWVVVRSAERKLRPVVIAKPDPGEIL